MTTADWVLVGLLALSVLLGVFRGFVREAVALAGWIAAIVLALRYSSDLGAALPIDIAWPAVRTGLGAVLIVVATVFVAALLGWALKKLLAASNLTAADRVLGGLFGVVRALLVVFVFAYFTSGTAVSRQPWWRDSALLPPIESALRFAAPHLPASFARPSSS